VPLCNRGTRSRALWHKVAALAFRLQLQPLEFPTKSWQAREPLDRLLRACNDTPEKDESQIF